MVAVAGVLLTTTEATAQTGGPANFDFTFSNPGARSMGFGGAFAPLADDATAAFANPAGLVQLLRPELSAELRLGIDLEDDSDDQVTELTGLGFASFVYPLRRWSFAAYGHRVGTLEVTPQQSGTGATRVSELQWSSALALELWRYGVAAGYKLDEHISAGVGVSYFGADTESSTGDVRLTKRSDVGLNAGLLWSPGETWNFGCFYREGPDFRLSLGDAGDSVNGDSVPLAFPDSHGAGVAYRSPNGAFTVAAEWAHVQYSSLNAVAVAENPTEPSLLENVDEYHLGGEYAFLSTSPILALRFGAWTDPGRRRASAAVGMVDRSGTTDETHWATGLGLAWSHFQLDFGADYSESLLALSISGIVSF